MEDFLKTMETFTSNGNIESLIHLHNVAQKDTLGRASGEELTRAFQRIDPTRHTISFVYLLSAKVDKEISGANGVGDKNDRLRRIADFATKLIPRLNVDHVTLVIETYIRAFQNLASAFLEESVNAAPGVPLLKNAIKLVVGNQRHISSLHGSFFQMCMKAKEYEAGQELIRDDARELLKEKASGTPTEQDVKSVLYYFFYAGNLLCQAEQFQRALRMYMSVLVIPSTSVSTYVTEAYKKFVLINLILGSPVKELPSNMSCSLERSVKPKCTEYDELVKICRSTTYGKDVPGTVISYLNSVQKTIQDDGHETLAHLVIKRVRDDAVMRVAETFKVIKFEEMVRRAFLKDQNEAQTMIQGLIEGRRLIAVLDKSTGFITFDFPQTTEISAAMLDRCWERINELKVQVGKYDDLARSNKHYLLNVFCPNIFAMKDIFSMKEGPEEPEEHPKRKTVRVTSNLPPSPFLGEAVRRLPPIPFPGPSLSSRRHGPSLSSGLPGPSSSSVEE